MITLQGGSFQDNQGNILSYGSLTFKLNTDSTVTANPYGQVVSGVTTTVPLDIKGDVNGTNTFSIGDISIDNNVLTVTSSDDLTTFISKGDEVVFPATLAATFLEDQTVAVTSVTSGQFTAKFTHANYGPTSETSKSCTVGQAVQIYSNAELTPSGTAYIVNCYNQQGGRVWNSGGTVIFDQVSGSTVDLSDVAFDTSTGSVTYPDALLKNPGADQTINDHSLLPASGNTTQSLGSSSAPWNAYLNTTTAIDLTAPKLNNVLTVDGTTYANIAAALSALPTNGGVVVCPPGYRETISSQITLGSSSQNVLLVLSVDTILTCSISDGTSSMFSIHSGSGIIGNKTGQLSSRAGGAVISLSSTANVVNVIETADNPQSSITLSGFTIDNVNGGDCSNAFIYLLNLNDASILRDLKGAYFPNYGMLISSTTGGIKTVGPLVIDNCYFDGVNGTNAVPLCISSDGAGSNNGTVVLGGYWLNPGGSLACILLNGNGGTNGELRDILIMGAYTQSGTNSSITGISITDAAGITVVGGEFQVTTSATGQTGIYIAESASGNTHSITVENWRFSAGSSNKGIYNNITSETLLTSTGNVPWYSYQGRSGTQVPTDSVFGGDTRIQIGKYLSSNTSKVRVTADSSQVGMTINNNADASFNALDLSSGASTAEYAALRFLDRNTAEWQIDKDPLNDLRVVDDVNSKARILIKQASGGATVDCSRLGVGQSTNIVTGDCALGGSWGTSPSVSSVAGKDGAGKIVVTSGSGSPGASPTVTFTFHDGTWTNTPIVLVNAGGNYSWYVSSVSATTVTFTFNGTPGASTAYTLYYHVIGN